MHTQNSELLLLYMLQFVGTPYKYGGNVPGDGGIDCSGLALIYLQAAGKWPHKADAAAQDLFSTWEQAKILPADRRFGDLAFYGSSRADVGHVGLVLNQSLMLEAGGGDGTTTTAVAAAARDAMVRVRPITYRRDFLAVLRPA